jgi:hypothetical protein
MTFDDLDDLFFENFQDYMDLRVKVSVFFFTLSLTTQKINIPAKSDLLKFIN